MIFTQAGHHNLNKMALTRIQMAKLAVVRVITVRKHHIAVML